MDVLSGDAVQLQTQIDIQNCRKGAARIILNVDIMTPSEQMFSMFVFGFYGPVNNEVMSSRSVNSGTVPGQA